MSYEMVGILYEKGALQKISEIFNKKEIVIEHSITRNEKKITNFVKFQLINERCDLVNDITEGSTLKIYFNIKGRKVNKDNKNSYYINLDVWKIECIKKEKVGNEFKDLEINDFLPF